MRDVLRWLRPIWALAPCAAVLALCGIAILAEPAGEDAEPAPTSADPVLGASETGHYEVLLPDGTSYRCLWASTPDGLGLWCERLPDAIEEER